MGKQLYISEKPSVAKEFAKALKVSGRSQDGYLESEDTIITWCVGHLITMSYPEAYDASLKRWTMEKLPFFPSEWKYEVISNVKKQFQIVKGLLNRGDVDCIYICTDSGREGEYIYRLVDRMAGVRNRKRLRVWIDSQTEEEILRGIREAKDWSEYDNLSHSAYLRAKEDYLMGINFSRALTLKFGPSVAEFLQEKRSVISVGRVMTCVLGMVVRREREIRTFVKSSFYRVLAELPAGNGMISAEWRAVPGSAYEKSPLLYKENGFREKKDAEELIRKLSEDPPLQMRVVSSLQKQEKKYAPLLFNLAELQNVCSRRFHISPDQTLNIVQELYEKKMVTYPRTDARVLSSAVAKEIYGNINGLCRFEPLKEAAEEILQQGSFREIGKSRYTNDSLITDHYAIIPTGQGIGSFASLSETAKGVYEIICRRFLSIFCPPAVYRKYSLELERKNEHFFAAFRTLEEEGYLKIAGRQTEGSSDSGEEMITGKTSVIAFLSGLKRGQMLPVREFSIKEGETAPPKRYNSGSLILAMENAGQLIEDESLREQIRGSGIGTSATRADILKKLVSIHYLKLNRKTQIISPEKQGEAVYEVVNVSMRQLLNPDLTASWEKGLSYVAEGTITPDEYMQKLERFVALRTNGVKQITNPEQIRTVFSQFERAY